MGLIPWVPLTRTSQTPDELMVRCSERIATVPDEGERHGLEFAALTFAGLAFPQGRFANLFGGKNVIIDSPFMDEIKAEIWAKAKAEARAKVEAEVRAEAQRQSVVAALEVRFGPVPANRITTLSSVTDEARLRELHRLAVTCPDLDVFVAELAAGQ